MEPSYSDVDQDDILDSDDNEVQLQPLRRHKPLQRRSFDFDHWEEPRWLPDILRSLLRNLRLKYIPTFKKVFRAIEHKLDGPHKSHTQSITPILKSFQHAPLQLRDRFISSKGQLPVIVAIFLWWSIVFSSIIWQSSTLSVSEQFNQPTRIRCMQQAWSIKDNCGIDGTDCRPFTNMTTAFYCQPGCASKQVWNIHTVGDQEIIYQQLVIGGPVADDPGMSIYRADSSICQAAIHAGVLSDSYGGIVVMDLSGSHHGFRPSVQHGVQSVGFDAEFPKAFTFLHLNDDESQIPDRRWLLLSISVCATAAISLIVTSPSLFFAPVFTILFLHVALVSDKPDFSTYSALLSSAAGRLLPALFVAYVLYLHCVRPQLSGLTAQYEKTFLWLGAAWFGALENYTLDYLPIRRLTPHDIQTQPGAIATLMSIIIILAFIVVGQIYYLRLEGRLIRFIKVYICMSGMLVCLAFIPSLTLRIHHYILALLLLPGTAIQTRPSLLYQGLLIGLFVNGVARWGFASILQTDEVLRDLDGPYNSLLPVVSANVRTDKSAIDFDWSENPLPKGYSGLSILVNDVERHRWYVDDRGWKYTWIKPDHLWESRTYFRFAYISDGHALDYTRPGIWETEGSWNASLWDSVKQEGDTDG